ncbi:related to zinc alcohol dehydrogenase [Rhynchosporium secalis]|uniref:Related to zinc alcohol dehydrogenase n=1 Tax=Rhynchosporium secalis TaxID=38038 RepID=A0A1E1LYS0_RHYSE|nr:related to zinc alcohol dehydrogenase [Rhynchosporium secalis]
MASKTPGLPSKMRSAQWTTSPIESTLHLNPSTPIPSNASSLPNNSGLVKVSHASLNPVDLKASESFIFRLPIIGSKAPHIPSCDFSGTVISTNNLPHLKPGDRVVRFTSIPEFGTLADYVVVEGRRDHVVIHGASGGTGHFGIQIAKLLGCTVTAICSAVSTSFCKTLGADHVIDYNLGPVCEQLRKSGRQYDLIVDNVAVGGPIYAQAHHYLKPAGIYVTIAAGPDWGTVSGIFKTFLVPAWLGGGRRKSVLLGHRADRMELEKLAAWVGEGKIKPEIERVYGLGDAGEAFRRLRSGRTIGKSVINVEQD